MPDRALLKQEAKGILRAVDDQPTIEGTALAIQEALGLE